MTRIRICRDEHCKNAATSGGFCRLHYLKSWKRLREEEHKRAAKRLNRYIESIVKRHPDRYVEMIKKDLSSPDFERLVDMQFGDEGNSDFILDEPAYDEEVRDLIEKFKKDSEG